MKVLAGLYESGGVCMAGHTYLTYGPLLNAATNVMYEGIPLHPDPSRMWQIVEKHKVRCTTLHAPSPAS